MNALCAYSIFDISFLIQVPDMHISKLNQSLLYTAKQSQFIDGLAGADSFLLMQQAGKAVFNRLISCWPHLKKKGVLYIFCGAGNNAGDGYVVANYAQKINIRLKVIAVKHPNELRGPARLAWKAFEENGGCLHFCNDELPDEDSQYNVIVDALLGTGLNGRISEAYERIVRWINVLGWPVMSVDIPSGLSADSGCVMGVAVHATHTVSIITLKRGLFTGDGKQLCGKVYYADLELPEDIYKKVDNEVRLINPSKDFGSLKPRHDNTNKGSYGNVLLIGGDTGMGGAIIMAAESALNSGAGKIKVLTKKENLLPLLARCPELMVYDHMLFEVKDLVEENTSIVVGPGLGNSTWGIKILKQLKKINASIVYDADALNLISKDASLVNREANNLFTPHPGEAARLLGVTTKQIQSDRFVVLKQLQHKLGGFVILKGSGSLISDGFQVKVCQYGNGCMAVAGVGDILSGFLGGLLAQGYNTFLSACLAVYLHAKSGDEIVKKLPGKVGLRATELIPLIRAELNQLAGKNR